MQRRPKLPFELDRKRMTDCRHAHIKQRGEQCEVSFPKLKTRHIGRLTTQKLSEIGEGRSFPNVFFRLFYNWKTITGSAIISNTAIISSILNLVKTKYRKTFERGGAWLSWSWVTHSLSRHSWQKTKITEILRSCLRIMNTKNRLFKTTRYRLNAKPFDGIIGRADYSTTLYTNKTHRPLFRYADMPR